MKNWFINKWYSLERAVSSLVGALNWKILVLYGVIVLHWSLTYLTLPHLFISLIIAAFIDGIAFRQGIENERHWTRKFADNNRRLENKND